MPTDIIKKAKAMFDERVKAGKPGMSKNIRRLLKENSGNGPFNKFDWYKYQQLKEIVSGED